MEQTKKTIFIFILFQFNNSQGPNKARTISTFYYVRNSFFTWPKSRATCWSSGSDKPRRTRESASETREGEGVATVERLVCLGLWVETMVFATRVRVRAARARGKEPASWINAIEVAIITLLLLRSREWSRKEEPGRKWAKTSASRRKDDYSPILISVSPWAQNSSAHVFEAQTILPKWVKSFFFFWGIFILYFIF